MLRLRRAQQPANKHTMASAAATMVMTRAIKESAVSCTAARGGGGREAPGGKGEVGGSVGGSVGGKATAETMGRLVLSTVTVPPNQRVVIDAGVVVVRVVVMAVAAADDDVKMVISTTIEPELTAMMTSLTPGVVFCSCASNRTRNAAASNVLTSPAIVN